MGLKEIRSVRIFDIAVFDLVLSLVLMVILFTIIWKVRYNDLDWWKFAVIAIILTIPLGILIHVLFGVNTSLNYRLGLSYKPDR